MPKNTFSPMMAALTKPKLLQSKTPGRQFGTVASGGNVRGSRPFSDKPIGGANPSILAMLSSNQYGGKLGK